MNIDSALKKAHLILKHIESRYIDSNLLLCFVLKQNLEYIISNDNLNLTQDLIKKYFALIKRRAKYEPIAYIIGYKDFFSRKFFINKNLLIPRSDTEILVTNVIKICKTLNKYNLNILEIGTGSAVIAVSLALELEALCPKIYATDISHKILSLAKKNSIYHDAKNISFIKSDLFKNLGKYQNYFDIIVSNPPYIDKKNEKSILSPDIKYYEPKKSLYAAHFGLFFFQKILAHAKKYLKKDGLLFLEVNSFKINSIMRLVKFNNFSLVDIYYDLQNLPRVIKLKL